MKIVFIGLLATAAATAFSSNLLVNGSFEADNIASFQSYAQGSGPTGWNLTFASQVGFVLDNSFTGENDFYDTPAGEQYFYIGNNASVSNLEQRVTLDPGTYNLSFLQADFRTAFATPGGQVRVNVLDPLNNNLFTPQLFTTPNFSDFTEQTLQFTVTSTALYRINFLSIQNHAGMIDDVRLEAVPEPITLALIPLAALAFKRKSRRA